MSARSAGLSFLTVFIMAAVPGAARVMKVGPGQRYATPCQAITAAGAGDRIEIDAAGLYRGDVCGWRISGLTLVGVNGRPKIDAAGRSAQGKGTWVISGDNTTVDNIEFTGARVPDHNGAAIRQEGANLILRNCYLHHNEEGILTGSHPTSQILIENTEFEANGYEDGQAHNMYIGQVAQFTLQYSYSHAAISGHLVKSRARRNFILYNRLTGENGTASYELDLPNGGLSYVIGNVIEQGPTTENESMVAFGEEGLRADSNLYFINNTMLNRRRDGTFLQVNPNTPPPLVQNNIFSGGGELMKPAIGNMVTNVSGTDPKFVNAGAFDFHLQPTSPARDMGSDPGGAALRPGFQYVHPTCFEARSVSGAGIDAGAFEFEGGGGPSPGCAASTAKAEAPPPVKEPEVPLPPGRTPALLRVGPGEKYAAPCAAIAAAVAGDRIEIDAAGTYMGDVCLWRTSNLTVVGVNGRPKLDAAGRAAQGRAIWRIAADNTTVENIEFTGAFGPNNNAAGILLDGSNMTVRKCYFHHNQEGILTGEHPQSQIVVENTEFAFNGYEDGQSHNIYIGGIAKFTLQFSYSHDAIAGHLVKSRARENHILYNRLTGEIGTGSYELDLPNGGLSFVIGNVIEQGPTSENSVIVAYAEEGAKEGQNALYFINNTVVNHQQKGTFLKLGGNPTVVLQNNIFSGQGTMVDPPLATLSHNVQAGDAFVDPTDYDYHLRPTARARDAGANPESVNGVSLRPVFQYVHPTCFETRKIVGRAIDAGAFEAGGGGGASPTCAASVAAKPAGAGPRF